MNSPFHKVAILLIAASLLLSACGSSLWGTYDLYLTPTSGATRTVPVDPITTSSPTPTASPFPSLATAIPTYTSTPTVALATDVPVPSIAYISQSGDSLNVIATHFDVQTSELVSSSSLPVTGFINPGTLLFIPDRLSQIPTTPSNPIIPDSELVDSPSAVGFDIQGYVNTAGGKLSTFHEYMVTVGTITGAEGVNRISLGSSISPRLLLALIQYYTGWVEGQPKPNLDEKSLLGYSDPNFPGLYQQMRLMVRDLLTGYYSWRAGTLTELTFPDGTTLRLAPSLNAGSVALQYMFSRHLNQADWVKVIDPETGFTALYKGMFGDPFDRAQELGPLFPPDLNQPTFTLPFEVGALWAYSGGPHPAWEQESALAALDFAPAAAVSGCTESNAWVVAIAPGQIVRSESSYVVLDLDGDGFEQTGWVVIYQHIGPKDRITSGTRVAAGAHIGHPSCEGGIATGTNLHIARKYNGEWVSAGDPLPFVMSGWTAHFGSAPYKGTLTKGDKTITASQNGTHESQIIRQSGE
jgi:LasA protease